MASTMPPQPISASPHDNNALLRRPVPGEGVSPIISSDEITQGSYAPAVSVAPQSKRIGVNEPSDDGRTTPYERRRDISPDRHAGPNTPYWERRRQEREQERERDPAWRERPEYYSEFQPYADRDRYGGLATATDSRLNRSNSSSGPPRVPPYQHGRYDDAAGPTSGPLTRNRADDFDEEAQFEDYLAWKHSRGQQRRRRSSVQSRGRPVNVQKKVSKARSESPEETAMRIPFLDWMGWTAKGHLVAFFGEFVGTTMFLFFAFAGTQVANVNSQADTNSTTGAATGFNAAVLLYIALVFGFSLMVNVWVFYRISGGLFNPAVTLAMLLVHSVTAFRALLLLTAQILGSIFASFLVKTIFPTNFNVRTTLSADTSLTRGVFIEGILTAELIFAIFMLAKEKHKATFIAPVGIGLALFIAELVGVYYTGGSLNPARSFGPCVVTKTFDREHWIYWVGPAGGAIVATILYKFILYMQYELANPGQDEESEEKAAEAAEEAKAKVDELEEEDREKAREEDPNRL